MDNHKVKKSTTTRGSFMIEIGKIRVFSSKI